ncbi:P-loop containing nucleoside triphosphate hydrolases superfamily protein, partial [Striga hermonthica]
QIELFSHVRVLKNFSEHLRRKISMAVLYTCLIHRVSKSFITDVTKFISGCMLSLRAMAQLELVNESTFSIPHVNILSKTDLVANKDIE